jgi:phytanoyl-CoA hydroxylase
MSTLAIDSQLITSAQIQQLDELGYFITDPLFPLEDLKAVEREFAKLSEVPPDRTGGNFACFLHKTNPACAEFCRHPVFAAFCRQLLGPEVYQTWNQMIVKKPGQAGTFGWHQDAYYGVHNPNGEIGPEHPDDDFLSGVITLWVAITRTTIDNGCLWVLPGRHKEGLLPHHWDTANKEWVGDYDTSEQVPAELAPGQMLAFTRLTPHSSGPNVSQTVRMGYQIGYSIDIGIRDMVPFIRDGRRIGD